MWNERVVSLAFVFVVASQILFGWQYAVLTAVLGVLISQLFVQGSGISLDVPAQVLSMLPYLATIIVLVIISRDVNKIRLNSPAALGQPYRADG